MSKGVAAKGASVRGLRLVSALLAAAAMLAYAPAHTRYAGLGWKRQGCRGAGEKGGGGEKKKVCRVQSRKPCNEKKKVGHRNLQNSEKGKEKEKRRRQGDGTSHTHTERRRRVGDYAR